jgi:hypothetical protein
MAEHTKDDEVAAEEILYALFEGYRGGVARPPDGVSLVDLQRDANEFRYDFDLIREAGAMFPALKLGDGGLVPVALSTMGLSPIPRRSFSIRREPFLKSEFEASAYLARALHGEVPGYELITREQAQETFLSRARAFLAHRIWASRSMPSSQRIRMPAYVGAPVSSVGGCAFQVSTQTAGLRVFWSGAYFIAQNYFAHPTSPARSVLQAGTYVFGVDGGAYGGQIHWDTNAVCTLPGPPAVALNF